MRVGVRAPLSKAETGDNIGRGDRTADGRGGILAAPFGGTLSQTTLPRIDLSSGQRRG